MISLMELGEMKLMERPKDTATYLTKIISLALVVDSRFTILVDFAV